MMIHERGQTSVPKRDSKPRFQRPIDQGLFLKQRDHPGCQLLWQLIVFSFIS
jgi:hypothetical protein